MPTTVVDVNKEKLDEKKKLRDIQYSIIRDTGIYYYKSFYSPAGTHARQYMKNRAFDDDIVKMFGIGYSPNMYGLVEYLQAKSYDMSMCATVGVVGVNSSGKYYDAMCGRLVVPIINIYNKVIAFGGRALDDKTGKFGKYKNTSETVTFAKTSNLYAINMAKKAKQNANLPYIIMVEGYMDVIAMAQAGYMQCVASMGTSLTQPQAKLLSRLVDKVYICYDGDSAGQKATIRGLDILANEGLEVFVMSVPESLDPDEYIGKYGKDAFGSLIDNALPLIDYKLVYLERFFHLGESTTQQNNLAVTKYTNACIQLLSDMDEVVQKRYIDIVASKSGYTAEFLQRKINSNSSVAVVTNSNDNNVDMHCYVASCLLASSQYALPATKPISDIEPINDIFDYIYQCHDEGQLPRIDMVYTVAPQQEQGFYDQLLYMQDKPIDKVSIQYYNDCLAQIQLSNLRNSRQALSQQLKCTDINSTQFGNITQQIQLLDEQINALLTD